MKKCVLSLLYLLCTLLSSASAWALDYQGRIQISEKGRAASALEYADLVIFFLPAEMPDQAQALAEPLEMRMENKSFAPRVLTITTGSTVEFPNFDPVLHNAFSTSRKNRFDLGFFGGGEKKSHVFDNPGLVRVYCNVHHDMVAYILVLNTPYYTSASKDGVFRLENLPELEGQLQIWHPRARVLKKPLDFSKDMQQDGDYQLVLTKRRIPKHLNKKGKSYSKSRKRRY